MNVRLVLGFLFAFALAERCTAQLATVTFTGVVTQIDSSPGPYPAGILVGDPLTLRMEFESLSPSQTLPDWATYTVSSGSMSIGSWSSSFSRSMGTLSISPSLGDIGASAYVSGSPWPVYLQLSLHTSVPNLISDDTVADIPTDLNGYDQTNINLLRVGGFRFGQAQLTGIAVTAVPEPGTYGIFGGLAALSLVALRKRRTREVPKAPLSS